jgi:hypothetical protein
VKLLHWLRKENSGLAHTTLELIEEETRQGHLVRVQEPSSETPLYATFDGPPDVHCIHSQLHPSAYHDGIPKVMWMHGEPLSSVGNGISMRAIVDLAPVCDAFICMRQDEHPVWNAIRRTYVVPKGINLERFRPMTPVDKLEGAPAVLYYENWRQSRNPLLLCLAMQEVVKVVPTARLHLFNCPGGKMAETFSSLIQHCRWYTFLKSLRGPQPDSNALLNRADIVVSCLSPLYARGIEAFGAGKAFIGPGYHEPGYPYTCELEVHSLAQAILRCWREYGSVDFRQWAEDHHDVAMTVKKSVEVYGRYC